MKEGMTFDTSAMIVSSKPIAAAAALSAAQDVVDAIVLPVVVTVFEAEAIASEAMAVTVTQPETASEEIVADAPRATAPVVEAKPQLVMAAESVPEVAAESVQEVAIKAEVVAEPVQEQQMRVNRRARKSRNSR